MKGMKGKVQYCGRYCGVWSTGLKMVEQKWKMAVMLYGVIIKDDDSASLYPRTTMTNEMMQKWHALAVV